MSHPSFTIIEVLQQLCQESYTNSKAKGFWTGEHNDNIPTKLCLMHSEISEWLEAFRSGNPICEKPISINYYDNEGTLQTRNINSDEEEAADLAIRLFDLCGKLNIDLGRCILAKMDYNSRRSFMHGNKRV